MTPAGLRRGVCPRLLQVNLYAARSPAGAFGRSIESSAFIFAVAVDDPDLRAMTRIEETARRILGPPERRGELQL